MQLTTQEIWKMVDKRNRDRDYQLSLINYEKEAYDTEEKIYERLNWIQKHSGLYYEAYKYFLELKKKCEKR